MMNKLKLISIFWLVTANIFLVIAQTGINKTPAAGNTLDVGGTVNIDGRLKFSGDQGLAGEVLVLNSAGNPSWSHLPSQYNRFRMVTSPLSTATSLTITAIPSSTIMVEVYGAGGGGSAIGGGGSGAYHRYLFAGNSNGSNLFTYTLGAGGDGAASESLAGVNGGSTSLIFNNATYITSGGDNASAIGTGNPIAVNVPSFISPLLSFFGLPGNPAPKTRYTYSQKNATTFVVIREFGNGADSPNLAIKGPAGGLDVINEATGVVLERTLSQDGIYNTGGGGGKFSTNVSNTVFGAKGGNAFMVFYWNQ